jgi:glycosyltransferase involved in cell wall biosynthesis
MIFAVPSKGRPRAVRTQAVLPSCVVYVPAAEVAEYEAAGVRNVVAVPDRVKGITATRNFILDQCRDRWVVMIDDDVRSQGWVQLLDERAKGRTLDEAGWIGEAVKLFDLTEQMRFRIWGVATAGATRAVYPWKPILTRSYVTGSFMGIVNDGRTRFDERFAVKEDYELNLRCVKEDGGVIAARYLHWTNSHWTDAGGCAQYRTQLVELRCIKLLTEMYPGMIRRITRGGSQYSIDLEF